MYDVVIIGSGVTGAAIASGLAKYDIKTCIFCHLLFSFLFSHRWRFGVFPYAYRGNIVSQHALYILCIYPVILDYSVLYVFIKQ